jgi:protease-4
MENNSYSFWPAFSLWNIVKALFLVLLLVNLAPSAVKSVKQYLQKKAENSINVAVIEIGSESNNAIAKTLAPIVASHDYLEQIQAAAKDDSIKAILLKIDSPGGVAAPCELIAAEVAATRKNKPIIAVVENLCASGAYWVASQCTKIVAPQSALIGSIGVLSQNLNFKGLVTRWDIQPTTIKAGRYKAVGDPFGETPQPWETKYREDLVNEVYKIFASAVADGRGLPIEKHTVWADGKIFTGKKALELRLIDQLGGMKEALKIIKEATGHEGSIELIEKPKPTLFARLLDYGTCMGQGFGLVQQLAEQFATTFCKVVKTELSAKQFIPQT